MFPGITHFIILHILKCIICFQQISECSIYSCLVFYYSQSVNQHKNTNTTSNHNLETELLTRILRNLDSNVLHFTKLLK